MNKKQDAETRVKARKNQRFNGSNIIAKKYKNNIKKKSHKKC